MSRDVTLMMRLQADASRMLNTFVTGERGVKRFVAGAKNEFAALKNSIDSVEGRLAGLGLTIGVTANLIQSARLDKSLIQIGQTASLSKNEIAGLRDELFKMSQETGQSVDDLRDGFNNAVQSGLKFAEAKNVIDATNKAMAVTGATADTLTASLTVAGTAYQFDLKKPEMALGILDQMTVAGRLGNAELANLSDIFSRVGPNAASAGLSFDKTLAFIEGLSQIERQPERLATLADSTLRLFNNLEYMKEAAKSTGVKFFNKDGTRRDAFEVIADIKKQYDKLNTEKEQALYIQKAFGKADLDTIKGMRVLLGGEMLGTIKQFSTEINNASGTIKRDLKGAIDNSVDQVGRLKSALRQSADAFAEPINNSINKIIQYTMNSKKDGGLGMDGNDMLMAGGGVALSALMMKRYGPKLLKSLGSDMTSLGTGVVTGKTLETAAGVMPVYVVNMPSGFGGATSMPDFHGNKPKPSPKGKVPSLGGWKNLGFMSLGLAPLTAMYGATEWAGDTSKDLSRSKGLLDFSNVMNKIFNYDPEAKQKAWRQKVDAELRGDINVNVSLEGGLTTTVKTNQSGVKVNVNNGQHMLSN